MDVNGSPEEAARMLDNLLGNLPGMAYRCLFNRQFTMLYMSKVVENLTGYTADELKDDQNISYADLIHPDDQEYVWLKVHQNVLRMKHFELTYRIITKNREIRWVWERGNAIYDPVSGNIRYLEGFITDISAQKLAEQEVVEREARLSEILKAVDIGVIFSDHKGMVVEVNEAFTSITGVGADEVKGHAAMVLAKRLLGQADKKKITADLIKALNGQIPEKTRIKFNQRLIELETRLTPTGQVITFLTDITRRKEYEDQLLQAKLKAEESDRLKSSFLANMSHEIRTPMNGIVGFTDLLKDEDLPANDRNRFIDIIQANAEQLLHIINDILDISRIEAGKLGIFPKEFDPYPMMKNLQDTATVLVKHKPIGIRLKYDLPAGFQLESDPNRVQQVYFNLVSNAIKFTDQGTIEIGCFRNSWDYIEFYVRDTGKGVPRQAGQKIFEPFRQGHEGDSRPYAGTGLGLSISQALIKLLGGQLNYTSAEGKGSYFYFTLPHRLVIR